MKRKSLSDSLSAEQIAERFDALQAKLVPLWKSIRELNPDEQTIVVIPSITMDPSPGFPMQAYEERFLFLLLLLRQPSARLVYVTSQPILPSIIEYYLDLLPAVIPSHARRRLYLPSLLDGSKRPLTEKILERPRFIAHLRSLIPNPDRAHMVPFNTTELERELALRLGIPMYGADPKFSHFGTKSGGRRIFAQEGIPHPVGYQDLTGLPELVSAISRVRVKRPAAKKMVVKLNEGVSGEGNAMVNVEDLPPAGSAEELPRIEERVRSMSFETADITFDSYMSKFSERGGIVEERIVGEEIRSPSVQMRVTPLGELQILSTHDQLLGGPSGQSYLGARFPADPAYAAFIGREGARIGRRLADAGVIGRFALDFIAARNGNEWRAYAIEINLRKGGTTHPFLTLQFLTDGAYSPETGFFTAPNGRQKSFVASDHVESPMYHGLSPDDLFDVVVRRGLHFDQVRQTGVVFHMVSALSEHGRIGLTAVADTPQDATDLYERTVKDLNEEAEQALRDPGI